MSQYPPPELLSVKRRKWPFIAVGGGALLIGIVIGGAAQPQQPPVSGTARSTVTAEPSTNTETETQTVTVTETATATSSSGTGSSGGGITDGTYVVGTDIKPGTYHSTGGGECYWARLRSDNETDIIDNHLGAGPTTVTIKRTDHSFETRGCDPWVRR